MNWKPMVMLCILLCTLFLGTAVAECDEERIKSELSILLIENKDKIMKNTDDSFKAYEDFNTKQLYDFIHNIDETMQQGVIFGLIAWSGVVLLVLSGWSFIKMKKERAILTHLLQSVHGMRDDLLKFTGKPAITEGEEPVITPPKKTRKELSIEKKRQKLMEELSKLEKKEGEDDGKDAPIPAGDRSVPVHSNQTCLTYGYNLDNPDGKS